VATRLMVFEGDDVVQYMGTWSEYAVKAKERREEAAAARRAKAPATPTTTKDAAGGLSKNEARRREAWIAEVEQRIEALEAEKADILVAMADPALSTDERVRIAGRIGDIEVELAESLTKWETWSDEISG
jgi:ATPase subunit of ABC transporter with duplicated ATPase domains